MQLARSSLGNPITSGLRFPVCLHAAIYLLSFGRKETVTALAAALLEVLSDVTAPMRADSLSRVLFCTGIVGSKGDPFPIEQINTALDELLAAGQVERLWHRGTAVYRALGSKRADAV